MAQLRVKTIVDVIADAIRQDILAGHISPEEQITEKEIANNFDVARPTAKAAIERLIEARLLRRSGNQAAFVPKQSRAEILDIFRCRALIEGRAVEELAKSRKLPSAAMQLVEAIATSVNPSPAGRLTAEVSFLRALVDELGSPRLSQMHEVLMGETQLWMRGERLPTDSLCETYEALIAAIESGDGFVARQIAETRISNITESL